jgi:hypothetical protein
VTGFDVARNATVDASVGSWILWLDGDELLLEETGLECLLRDNYLDGICRCADRITVTRRRAS